VTRQVWRWGQGFGSAASLRRLAALPKP